jgi:hypothetical protein
MSKHNFSALFLLIALVFALAAYAQGSNVAPIIGTGSGVTASEGDMVGPQNPSHLPFYQSPTGYSTIYMYPKSVATSDLNCDGLPDIVAIGGGTQYHHLVCYVQDPNNPGSFFNGAIHNSGPGTQPTGVAVGDIDGDGKPDLAFSKFHTYGLHTATVLINTTTSHSRESAQVKITILLPSETLTGTASLILHLEAKPVSWYSRIHPPMVR